MPAKNGPVLLHEDLMFERYRKDMKHVRRNILIGATAAALGAAAWYVTRRRMWPHEPDEEKNIVGLMRLTSPAFVQNGLIPTEYTCDGGNMNPPLIFENVPKEAASLVLIMDDPDVPKEIRPSGIFDHWVVFNIPSDTRGVAADSILPGTNGMNSAGTATYVGPCPPGGEHRYVFKLYALDTLLELPQGALKTQIEDAMECHVIDEAELIGRYVRI